MSLWGSPTFTVALYGGTTSSSLSLLKTTTIGDWDSEGQLFPQIITFATLPAGVPAWFQVQVYDSRFTSALAAWSSMEYAGVSQVFQATPHAAVYAPMFQKTAPINSTLPSGTFDLVDYPGTEGLIEIVAVPEPGPFALVGWGTALLMIYRRRV